MNTSKTQLSKASTLSFLLSSFCIEHRDKQLMIKWVGLFPILCTGTYADAILSIKIWLKGYV